MSTATISARARSLTAVHADRWGVLLAGLFMTVLIGSVWIATWLAGLGAEQALGGSSGAEQAAVGAGWAIAEVAVAVIGIAVVLAYRRLPEWAQEFVKFALLTPAMMYIGVIAADIGVFWLAALGLVGYVGITKVADVFDVYWLWNNVEAIALAIVIGGALGAVLPIPFLVAGIVGLTIYDHVFANEKDWMFTLGGGMLQAKLPVIVFAFPTLRVSWDDICESLAADRDERDEGAESVFSSDSGFGIGTADLLLPAAFASAVAVSGGGVTLAVVGVAAGVAVAAFRLRWEMINVGSGAGMPALTGGMLAGYVLAVIPVVVFG